jgi:hypothetical protein
MGNSFLAQVQRFLVNRVSTLITCSEPSILKIFQRSQVLPKKSEGASGVLHAEELETASASTGIRSSAITPRSAPFAVRVPAGRDRYWGNRRGNTVAMPRSPFVNTCQWPEMVPSVGSRMSLLHRRASGCSVRRIAAAQPDLRLCPTPRPTIVKRVSYV